MEKERKNYSYQNKIANSYDILKARKKIHEKAHSLGFEKPQLTGITSACSEVYRLFFNTLDEVRTEVYDIEETEYISFSISVYGILKKNSRKNNGEMPAVLKNKLDKKLSKVKTIFPYLDLSFDGSKIVSLTLIKKLPKGK